MWLKFQLIFEGIKSTLLEIAGWICFGMTCMIFVDVFGRYVFNAPLPSVYEISEDLLMVTFIFFAMASAQHIDVVALTSRLPSPLKRASVILRHGIGTLFLALLAWKSAEMAWTSWIQKEVSESFFTFPLYPGRVAVMIGFAVFTINEFITLVNVSRRGGR